MVDLYLFKHSLKCLLISVVGVGTCRGHYGCRSQGTMFSGVHSLSFHNIDPRGQPLVIRFCSKCLNLLNHLASLFLFLRYGLTQPRLVWNFLYSQERHWSPASSRGPEHGDYRCATISSAVVNLGSRQDWMENGLVGNKVHLPCLCGTLPETVGS